MALIKQTLRTFCRYLQSSSIASTTTLYTQISAVSTGLTVRNTAKIISPTFSTSAVPYSTKSSDDKYTKFRKFEANTRHNVHKPVKATITEGPNKYQPNSPYVPPVPYRYGYTENIHKGGLLPRLKEKMEYLPKPIKNKNWDTKHALFGQNDYIDILGDGSVHPVDLIQGPKYVIGFKGGELKHLMRRLVMQGKELKDTSPDKYHKMMKRRKYLWNKYNLHRGKRR